MNRLIRSSILATVLVVAAPGFALAAHADCTVPTITLVEPATSAIYVEWTSDVTNVNDYTVTLDQSGVTMDEQNVAADATSATFFGVAIGEDYHVTVSANTDEGTFTSLSSDPVAVTDAYIVVDPPVIDTLKLDPSLVSVTLSDDGLSWILSFPAIDQNGERGLYGFVTQDGQSCWAISPADAAPGDSVSCDVALLEDGSTPVVTEAYYQNDWVMYYSMRSATDVPTTIANAGDDNGEQIVPVDAVDPNEPPVPTPYDDVLMTTSGATQSSPNTAVSVGVLLLGALAAIAILRPRRTTP